MAPQKAIPPHPSVFVAAYFLGMHCLAVMASEPAFPSQPISQGQSIPLSPLLLFPVSLWGMVCEEAVVVLSCIWISRVGILCPFPLTAWSCTPGQALTALLPGIPLA